MKKTLFFQFILLGFFLGVAGYFAILFYRIVIGCVLFLLLFYSVKKAKTKVFFILLFFIFGFGVSAIPDLKVKRADSVSKFYDENKFFTAKVVDVQRSLTGLKVILQPKDYFGKVLFYEKITTELIYGDEVNIYCELKKPFSKNINNYYRQKQKDGILAVCQKTKIELMKKNQGNLFFKIIFSLKDFCQARLAKIFPLPYSALLSGILIGDVRELSAVEMDNFSTAGITHIVAVSGYNVNIIVAFILIMAKNFGWSRRRVLIFSIFFLIFFCILTGLGASVIRAALMSLVLLLAQVIGKKYSAINGLLFVAFVMILQNPLILLFDLGFQLSFLSTYGLLVWSKPIAEKIKFIPEIFSLRENLAVTFASMIMSAPIIIFSFGRFAIYSPIANLLVLPFIPLIMLFGFITLLFSFVFLPLAQIVSLIVFPMLFLVIKSAEIIANLPKASLLFSVPFCLLIFYYLFLCFLKNFAKKIPKVQTKV